MPTRDATFRLVADHRVRLADLAATLVPAQWETPSLARGWSVRDVYAHLTMPFEVSLPALVLGVARHRGSYDRYADSWARGHAARTPGETLAATLRTHAEHRFTPPGQGPEAPLTDVVVHGLDVAVPLGVAPEHDPTALGTVLDVLASRGGRGFGVRPERLTGRRLQADDLDWAHGEGPLTTAPARDLVLHLARGVPLPAS